MLSSTAKNLYWMGRYLQRAKSTARLIDATQRMALQSRGEEAAGVAAIFGMEDEFRQSQAQGERLASLIDFLVIDENNPSSIVNTIAAARRNAREERNNITVDVWESLNALGNGVADDKSTYTYVPDMVRFYLNEEPILSNVPTWRCDRADDFKYVIDKLPELVVKEIHGSGGKGMLVGPTSSKTEIEEFAAILKARPDNYIAQPTLALSTCPTFVGQGVAPRHVDLRPFVLSGRKITIIPGGLTRVALKEGSLVVNSSQGGGTKDTWVLAPRTGASA